MRPKGPATRKGLECQASGWISAMEEKAEEEQENHIPLREMKEHRRKTIWGCDGDININYVYTMFSKAISSGFIFQHK